MALSREQLANAKVIVQVGQQVGARPRDIQIALMTALQESGLRNLNYGDRDSLGLFQQRPSMGWGNTKQVRNPAYAARAFFLGAGTNKGLLDYSQRDQWSLTQAAQKVQRSAFPDAYAKHEKTARTAMQTLGASGLASTPPPATVDQPEQTTAQVQNLDPGIAAPQARMAPPTAAGVAAPEPLGVGAASEPANTQAYTNPFAMPQLSEQEFMDTIAPIQAAAAGGNKKAQAIIASAKEYLGVQYKWGGTTPLGFDCSGLLQYVFKKHGVQLPRVSFQQARGGKKVGRDQAAAGDLWWIDNSSRNNGADHIALYLGDGQILEAPRAGLSVRIRSLSDSEMAKGGFTRYL